MIFISKAELRREINNQVEDQLTKRLNEEVHKRIIEFLEFFLDKGDKIDAIKSPYYRNYIIDFMPYRDWSEDVQLKRKAVEQISRLITRNIRAIESNKKDYIKEEIEYNLKDPNFIRELIHEINSYQLED